MAETKEVKKRAPRKPKTATEVVAEAPLEVNEIKEIAETPVVEEEIAPEKVEEVAPEIVPEEKEKEAEIVEKEEEESPEISDEGTQLPEDITPFEEFKAPEPEIVPAPAPEVKKENLGEIPAGAAKIKKLNPYLDDGQSKWKAIVETKDGLVHELIRSSYVKALNAAENYNISHGFGKGNVAKIRK